MNILSFLIARLFSVHVTDSNDFRSKEFSLHLYITFYLSFSIDYHHITDIENLNISNQRFCFVFFLFCFSFL